jgi:cell division protein FtsB
MTSIKDRKQKPIGAETVNQNGYTSVKTKDGWIAKHVLVAEKMLGRKIDAQEEMVRFKDSDRTNFDPDNIIVVPKRKAGPRKRLAQLEARRDEIEAEIVHLKKEIGEV